MRKQILNYVIVSLCFYSINLFGTAINLNKYSHEIDTLEVSGLSSYIGTLTYVTVNVGEHSNKGGTRDDTMNWLEQLWTNITPRYKESNHVIYELQNEPCFSLSGYKSTTYKTWFLEVYNKVNPEDNSVAIIAEPSSDFQVEENGFSLWDSVKRKATLNYKYTRGDKDFEVEETLTFRNRIRDGQNEWSWEGFSGN